MVHIFRWRLPSHVQANLSEQKAYWKKNWLKGIGFWFLCMASLEYFTNHMFGCSLSAALLLGYAMYDRSKKHKQAELAKDENQASRYFVELVVVSLSCALMVFLTIEAMPPSLQSHLHLPR